jgi:tetratricopeptide (TPR) repeat protein
MKIILTILLIVTGVNCFAQFSPEEKRQIDSLTAVINNKASHDTSQAGAYVDLSDIFYVTNLDTTIYLCSKAQEIAEKALSKNPTVLVTQSLRKTLAGALNNIGLIHRDQGSISLALDYFYKSLKISEEIGDKSGIATLFNNIGLIHSFQGDIPLALDYYHKSLKIKEDIKDKKGMAYSYNNIGGIHDFQGDIPLALDYYHKSLKIREEIKDKQGMANSYNNIGYVHQQKGDIPLALDYYHKSLKIQEEIKDKSGMADSYNIIGGIHDNQGDIPLALEYSHKSLKIYEEIKDKQGMASCYNNIGVIHHNQGDIPLALEYYHKSLKIDEEIKDKQGMAYSYNNIGSIHFIQGDIPLALDYYHKSLKIYEEIKDKQGMANSYNYIGRLLLEEGKAFGMSESSALSGAREYGERGLQIAQEIGFPYLIQRNAGLLSKVAIKEGNYKQALEMRNIEVEMRDSVNNEEVKKSSIRQQTQYEFEKAQLIKEQELMEQERILLAEKERRDNMQYSIIFLGILIVFGTVLGSGKFNISPKFAEGLIFFAFLLFFEFCLVLLDPIIDDWSSGEPIYKLLFNAILAGAIFPLHAFFENLLKKRIIKNYKY